MAHLLSFDEIYKGKRAYGQTWGPLIGNCGILLLPAATDFIRVCWGSLKSLSSWHSIAWHADDDRTHELLI